MANELVAQSSSRNGAAVLWITIHTAEGATDEFPAEAGRDAGSARALMAFGQSKTDRSWHACCDDDILIDNLVPYDRASWTLRGGNVRSDNLEMCGLASWSRATWLNHEGMLRQAAKWVAGRCRARGITPRKLSIGDVQGRSARGYMDHGTYTRATGDGTHTDVGPHFPWDHFAQLVDTYYNGSTPIEEAFMAALNDDEQRELLENSRALLKQFDPKNTAGITSKLDRTGARLAELQSAVADDEAKVTGVVAATKAELLGALQQVQSGELDAQEAAKLAVDIITTRLATPAA